MTTTGRCGCCVIALSAAWLTLACAKTAPEEVESEAVVPVKTAVAAKGSVRGVIHATGLVMPAPGAELVVSAPEPARIAEIPPGEGDRVRRGDLLVRFEIPSLPAEVERQSAEVQRAEAAVANARANRARERDLFERGVAARKEVEDADRALADAEAALAQAQASRGAAGMVASRAVARATFDGVVAKRYHNPGDFVDASASDPVMRVIDLGRLEVVASVPLADAPRVVVGAAARITGASDAPALKVLSRPATVEEGTATVAIRLGFAGPVRYPAHAPVAVDIDSEKHTDVIVIPERALVRDAAETAVFVVSGGKAQRRPVETGLTDGSQIEITSGLKAGEVVIVEGQTGLPDGAAVNATGENAPEKTLEKEPAKEPGKESGKESEK